MPPSSFDLLTPTERRVLRLVHHSRKTDVIAAQLAMSRHTVDQHIAAARRKLGGVGRYVAADALRDHEAHPQPLGSETHGMDEPAPSAPSPDLPDPPAGRGDRVGEDRLPFEHDAGGSGAVDHLREWLRDQSVISRICLVLGAAILIVILVVVAPLFAEQMGRIGRIFYNR